MAEKFARSLYNAPRGELRLALLDALLPEMLELNGQPALDVGGGLGQQSAWLARRGHRVTLAEPSVDMLALARQTIDNEALSECVSYLQAPLQALETQAPGPWPLVICHAVLEWMGDPGAALAALGRLVAPGGQLSLMVFNRDALRFANVIKGNRQKALDDRLEGLGKRTRLTPVSPLTHAQVEHFAGAAGLCLDDVAGIRIFQDYLREPIADEADQATLFALERQYCRSEPHWRLGRYLLYTLRKPFCV
ncbi:MAG: methyltransferase domain-containing protein [Halomonas sp.]|nr:methyltransferase domain-containing protein [Halomonas sp.]MDN6298264.1 methyltransferase domain-containing protein [Halomonas sp.]MDN6314585.1 methyltransferase domain-containing protein [Halomonas sp.]MDN6336089.1 methyltransferase domain-containing protein [Halomonas sp.]